MTPILAMPSDRKQGVRHRHNPLGSGESGVPAAVRASTPRGRHRLDPGADAPGPPARKWEGRAVILGCLAWYLVVFGLLVLLASSSARRSTGVIGPPDPRAPTAVAPPEGPGRHQ
jgi:hypothetical protein